MDSEEQEISYESIMDGYALMYQVTGMLPSDPDREESAIRKALKKFLPRYCFMGVTIYYLVVVSYSLRMIQERVLDVDYISEFIAAHGVSLRYFMYYYKRKELEQLFRLGRELWFRFLEGREAKVMKNYTRIAHFFKIFFMSTVSITTVFYLLTAIFVRLPPQEVNDTERRIMFLKTFVDIQEEPLYSLITTLEVTATVASSASLIALETVSPLLIMMACGYLRILRNRLYHMSSTSSLNNASHARGNSTAEQFPREDVRICVAFHRKILVYCAMMENFSAPIFMIQVAASIYNCALIGLVLLSKNPNYMKQFPFLTFTMLQFFTCNWIPEILINESKEVANAAYSASFTSRNFDKAANRMLLLMIARGQKPVQLTAGGYVQLSLKNFKEMTMSALSFFTVLRKAKME